jgi:hypothetical protein
VSFSATWKYWMFFLLAAILSVSSPTLWPRPIIRSPKANRNLSVHSLLRLAQVYRNLARKLQSTSVDAATSLILPKLSKTEKANKPVRQAIKPAV